MKKAPYYLPPFRLYAPVRCNRRIPIFHQWQQQPRLSFTGNAGGNRSHPPPPATKSEAPKNMREWRKKLKKPRQPETSLAQARSPPPPSQYEQQPPSPPPLQQNLQPSFLGNMLTYMLMGIGMTAGIIFVRLATGMEPEPSGPLEMWPSRVSSLQDKENSEPELERN